MTDARIFYTKWRDILTLDLCDQVLIMAIVKRLLSQEITCTISIPLK